MIERLKGSNDVAQDKKTLNEFGITHVLNLAPMETPKFRFEDDFNYLEVSIRDEENFSLKSVMEKCFDFIDEGKFRGNCLVHCSTAKPGLSRSTSICIAYLMNRDKKSFEQAFADVRYVFLKRFKIIKNYYINLFFNFGLTNCNR